MNAIEATITNTIDINTLGGGHLRLMPGQYRVTPDRQGGAELVRIDLKRPNSPIRLTSVQWGILEAASFIKRSEGRGPEEARRSRSRLAGRGLRLRLAKSEPTTRRHGSSSWTSRSWPGLVGAQPQRGGSEQGLTSSMGQREHVDRPRFVRNVTFEGPSTTIVQHAAPSIS
jgi:hypothetical protein